MNPEVDPDDALGNLRVFLAKYATRPERFGGVDREKLQTTYNAVAQAQGLDPAVDVMTFLDLRFLPE
jgi:NitT/TauT family transport system substrate-binding protein